MRIWNLLSVTSATYLVSTSPAPYSVSSDLGKLEAKRHLSSGIDCAMAGAASVLTDATPPAPSAAVRKNLRRCIVPSQETAFCLPSGDSTERNQTCHAAHGMRK